MLINKKTFLLVGVIITINIGKAQEIINNKIQNNLLKQLYEAYSLQQDTAYNFYLLQPYTANTTQFSDYLKNYFQLKTTTHKQNLLEKTIRSGNMIELHQTHKNSIKSIVTINPLFNLEVGKQNSSYVFNANRGLGMNITINNKILIGASLYENLSKLPYYQQQYVDSLKVVPGMGMARIQQNNIIDYALPTAYIGYMPNDIFYFELGNDKNFIGNGYRSLFLSDQAYAYPYAKLNINLKKLAIQTIWTQFTDASNGWVNNNGYSKKYGLFNALSFQATKKLQLSFLQSVIWNNRDSLGNKTDINWGYYLPIVFLNSLNFNNGSPDNSVIGLDLRYALAASTIFYTQIVIDDFNLEKLTQGKGFFQNKYGIQAGFKFFDPLKIKNSFARIEYNTVRPYTYANKLPSLNYTHYNEVLAHPLGANFKELVLELNYKYKRFLVQSTSSISKYGNDEMNTHWGRNIYKSDYASQYGIFSFNNKTTQGIATHLIISTASFNYLMNPFTNSSIALNLLYRKEKNSFVQNKNFVITVSYKTSLLNNNNLF